MSASHGINSHYLLTSIPIRMGCFTCSPSWSLFGSYIYYCQGQLKDRECKCRNFESFQNSSLFFGWDSSLGVFGFWIWWECYYCNLPLLLVNFLLDTTRGCKLRPNYVKLCVPCVIISCLSISILHKFIVIWIHIQQIDIYASAILNKLVSKLPHLQQPC